MLGAGKYCFVLQLDKAETPTPMRFAASPNEIGASLGGILGVDSPRLRLLLASNCRCRYSGSCAYRCLRSCESLSLFALYQRLKLNSFFFRISAMLQAPQ